MQQGDDRQAEGIEAEHGRGPPAGEMIEPSQRAGPGAPVVAVLGTERGEKAGLEGIRHAFDDFDTVPSEDRWAAYRLADQVFHRSIIEFSGNQFLIDLARTSAILTRSNLRGLVRPPSQTLPEHRSIIESMDRGDPLAAQEQVILHMLRSRDKLRTMPG